MRSRSLEGTSQEAKPPRTADGDAQDALESESFHKLTDRAERGDLWLGHFQHLTTLTVAGGAGLLVLLQLGVMERTSLPFFVSLIACGIALILCLGGQAKVLDSVDAGRDQWRDLREIRRAVFVALAVAAVAFVVLILV